MENRSNESHANGTENKNVVNKSNSILKFKKRTFDNKLSSVYDKKTKRIYVPQTPIKTGKKDISR